MLSLLLATTLAAAPAPRALASANTVVHIPQLDKLSGLQAFLSRAGTYAALARPDTLGAEFHPFLTLDPSAPESLSAVGIDPAGSTTLSFIERGKVSCSRLADPKAFQAKAAEALASGGQVKTSTTKGMTTASAPRGMGRAGYVLKGSEACSFITLYDDDDLLKDTVKLMGKAPATDCADRQAARRRLRDQRPLAVGLDGTANELMAEGTATQLPLPPFQASSASPYGAMKPEGLLFSRAQVAPAGLSQAVGSVSYSIQQLCAACPPGKVDAVAQAVTQQLTGHLLVLVDSVQVKCLAAHARGPLLRPAPGRGRRGEGRGQVEGGARPAGELPRSQGAGGWVLAGARGRHPLRAAEGPAARDGQ